MWEIESDQATVSRLYTIAIRTWEEPTGPDRDDRLDELTAAAGGRMDLLAEAVGILLGTRPADEHDPRHRQRTAGAEMLLDAAGVRTEDRAEAVRQWVPIGEERRERWRHPVNRGGIA